MASRDAPASIPARESLRANPHVLACPLTRLPVRECSLDEALSLVGGGSALIPRQSDRIRPIGLTHRVMLRSDNRCAFPIVDGIPILLTPEMLLPQGQTHAGITEPKYAEAYEEMEFYGREADEALAMPDLRTTHGLANARHASPDQQASFPEPAETWIDSVYDCVSQTEAYGYLAPLNGKRLLQIGGKGSHAVKFLLAGGDESWLVSPVVRELAFGVALAQACGVLERFHCVAGVAEEMPFADKVFDGAYSGSALHHTVTSVAFPEVFRVLTPGGRLSAVEPWQAPFYGIGTRLLGKREAVNSLPLSRTRAAPLFEVFPAAEILHHGSLSRYPLVALSKVGLDVTQSLVRRITRIDDAICSVVPPLRRLGSSAVLRATRIGDTRGRHPYG